MSTNKKKEKTPEELEAIKQLEAAKKSNQKALEAVTEAEEKFKSADEKSKEKAKADLKAKKEALESVRVKNAQSGSYLPNQKEKGLFHVKMDKPSFHPSTGKKLSKAFIQKFTVREWAHFVKYSGGLGYTMEILWNPTLYSA